MKKLFCSALVLAVASCVYGNVILERFDAPDKVSGKILPAGKAELLSSGGTEGGCLFAKGIGKTYQYIYSCPVKAQAGEKYALALNYKTTQNIGGGFMFIITYQMQKGVKAPPTTRFTLHQSYYRWSHKQFELTVPDGAIGFTVNLRMAGMKENDQIWVDFLRIAPIVDGTAKGIDLESFDTTFDPWQSDKQPLFDHFMPGKGGKVIADKAVAKVGGACFQASGSGEKMQYALYIDNIKVKPGNQYTFNAWFKSSENFKYFSSGMLIFFYKDKDGKICKGKNTQSRYSLRSTKGQWKECVHKFTVPADCAYVDIGLNMRNMKAQDTILLDHLRFKAETPAAK